MAAVVKFRMPYDLDAAQKASEDADISFVGDPGVTDQSGKDDADINVLLRRFGVTGVMPAARRLPQYGDFTGVTDYQTALNSVMEAEEAFMSLPADLRKRFDNDPGELLEFLSHDENREEAQKLGLLEPEPVPVPPQEVIIRGGALDPLPDPKVDSGGK